MNVADVGTTVFDWLLALSGLSTLFTWLAICLQAQEWWEARM